MLRQNVVHMWHQDGTRVNMDFIVFEFWCVTGSSVSYYCRTGVQFLVGVPLTSLSSVYRWEVADSVIAFSWVYSCVYGT